MIRILIVDDDNVVRTSFRTMADWEDEGFEVTDAPNGKAALDILKKGETDILLTDVKMPVMDGIALLEHVSKLRRTPVSIVISAYNDFPYVRQAFRLGASDYMLKSDITPSSLLACVKLASRRVNPDISPDSAEKALLLSAETLRRVALGVDPPAREMFPTQYILVCFEIDSFADVSARFGTDIKHNFVSPLLEFARQIPRIASRCIICDLAYSRFLMLYSNPEETDNTALETIRSICRQVIQNWKNYMNITASAGIADSALNESDFEGALEQTIQNVSAKFILGRGNVYGAGSSCLFDVRAAAGSACRYAPLLQSLKEGLEEHTEKEVSAFVSELYSSDFEDAAKEVLNFIYQASLDFSEKGGDILQAFEPCRNCNFYEKIHRLKTTADLGIWFRNFTKWFADYIKYNYRFVQNDAVSRAKSFIRDNFHNPALTLGEVAEHAGLNEKYFSTRFKETTGEAFSAYLNRLRVSKAIELMADMNLKIYQISEMAGYNSVEHFNRIFKKVTGKFPSQFR